MCGIAGIIYFDRAAEGADIARMTATLSHRGPDGCGTWLGENIALGHRRLAIIDLDAGRQPLCNETGTIWITYNGEIYNFLALRSELTHRGHRFATRSDTEVIVHAYEEWGDDCVSHFRGMFAFGIVDTVRRRVLLARDHLGIKPLVYYQDGTVFAFASEIQALRSLQGAHFDLDLGSIDQYLCLQYIPAPRSIYRQVKKLAPAHRISISFDGAVAGPQQYWALEFRPDYSRCRGEWLEELDALLRKSVAAHLIADVPFGAFLSGGVDSGATLAYMAQRLNHPVKTFSIGFREPEYDELRYAKIAAARWGTEHHFKIVTPDALGILPKLVQHYGEPFGDSSALPTYFVSKLARGQVAMVLSGDGGDEAFGGYDSYRAWLSYLSAKPTSHRPWWKEAIYPLAHLLRPARFAAMTRPPASLENWLRFIAYMPGTLRTRLWRQEYASLPLQPLESLTQAFADAGHFTNAHKAQYMDIKTYLPDAILTKVDIASMMNGLEVRTPFVDKEVMEFAARIPERFNIRGGRPGWRGKLLLKQLMSRYYGKAFVHRRKMGFAVPLRSWFSDQGALRETVNERLIGSDSRLREYFDLEVIAEMLRNNDVSRLWLLLFLDEWLLQSRS